MSLMVRWMDDKHGKDRWDSEDDEEYTSCHMYEKDLDVNGHLINSLS
jgi:hypothetical protein